MSGIRLYDVARVNHGQPVWSMQRACHGQVEVQYVNYYEWDGKTMVEIYEFWRRVPRSRVFARTYPDFRNPLLKYHNVSEEWMKIEKTWAQSFLPVPRGGISLPEQASFNGVEWYEELSEQRCGVKLRNVVVVGLGSLHDMSDGQWLYSIRRHRMVWEILQMMRRCSYDEKTKTWATIHITFEDAYYTDADKAYLNGHFNTSGRFSAAVSNDGSGWRATMNDDCLFITFKPNDPYREIMADLVNVPGGSKRPRAVICRPATETQGRDTTSTRVVEWLTGYWLVAQPTLEDNEVFGRTVLHVRR